MTGATDTGNRLTIVADGMSTHGVITKNIMIVIRRPTEPKDTLLSTITRYHRPVHKHDHSPP